MVVEKGPKPSLNIQHWNYRTAYEAGYPDLGVMGIYVDVVVVTNPNGEITQVFSVRELKIEWERFKRDEDYANQIRQAAQGLMDKIKPS